MKYVFSSSLLLLCLSGCGPMSIYYREGASVSRMQSETTQCELNALNQAPVATQVRQSPPVYFPGRTYCDGAGRCHRSPGWWSPGRVYTVDTNQGLRNQVAAQCMAAKGYAPVSLPPCRPNVKSQVAAQRTQTLPPLTDKSCFVKFDDGSFQIITPAQAG